MLWNTAKVESATGGFVLDVASRLYLKDIHL